MLCCVVAVKQTADTHIHTYTNGLSRVLLQGSEKQQSPEQIVLVPLHRHSGLSGPASPYFSCHVECGEGSSKRFLLLVVKSCRKEGEMVLNKTHCAFSISASQGLLQLLFPSVHLDLFIWDLCLDTYVRHMITGGKIWGLGASLYTAWACLLRENHDSSRSNKAQTGGDWQACRDAFSNEDCRIDLCGQPPHASPSQKISCLVDFTYLTTGCVTL